MISVSETALTIAIFFQQCSFHERTQIKRSGFILFRVYRLLVHTKKGRNQCILFYMMEALDQGTIYVQKSETEVVFCNRNQFRVVTQKHLEEEKNLSRVSIAGVE